MLLIVFYIFYKGFGLSLVHQYIGPSQMVTRVTILMALMPLDIGLKPNPLIKYLIKYGLSTHSGDWPTSQAGLVA